MLPHPPLVPLGQQASGRTGEALPLTLHRHHQFVQLAGGERGQVDRRYGIHHTLQFGGDLFDHPLTMPEGCRRDSPAGVEELLQRCQAGGA